jgi:anti-sigma-K factor RskA
MKHVDPDVIALLALGEHVESADDRAHIAACEACNAEFLNLQHAAVVARSTMDSGELVDPPERVWSRISDELFPAATRASGEATVTMLRPRKPRRRMSGLAAAAAVVLVLGGVGAAWFALRPVPVTVLASAQLDAFPAWPGSSGTALVEKQANGARVIALTLRTSAGDDGYREVWLISSDARELVSLGVVHGATGTFTVPDGLDLSKYDLVDVSSEPFDGDPTHSGDSIMRGQLS